MATKPICENQELISSCQFKKIVFDLFMGNASTFITDVAKMDFIPQEYKERLGSLDHKNKLFCDNIILYLLTVEQLTEYNVKKTKKILNKEERKRVNNLILKCLKDKGIKNKKIDIEPKNCAKLISKYSKSKESALEKAILENAEKFMNETNENNRGNSPRITLEKVYRMSFKISFSSVDFNEEFISKLGKCLEALKKYHIYLHDIDITKDCAGTMCPELLIKNLEDAKIAYRKNSNSYQVQTVNEENKGNFPEIKGEISEKKNHGKHCVMFFFEVGGIVYRCKLYNKFLDLLLSPGIKKDMGNRLQRFICKPDDLPSAFKNETVRNHGITRLEISIYCENLQKFDHYKKIMEDLLINPIAEKPWFYPVPLNIQAKCLYDKIQSSLLIFDIKNEVCWAGFWINSETRKVICRKICNKICFGNLRRKSFDDFKEMCISACAFNTKKVHAIILDSAETCKKNDKNEEIPFKYECRINKTSCTFICDKLEDIKTMDRNCIFHESGFNFCGGDMESLPLASKVAKKPSKDQSKDNKVSLVDQKDEKKLSVPKMSKYIKFREKCEKKINESQTTLINNDKLRGNSNELEDNHLKANIRGKSCKEITNSSEKPLPNSIFNFFLILIRWHFKKTTT